MLKYKKPLFKKMKKEKLYAITLVCLLISFFYDKQIISIVVQNRIGWMNGFIIWITNPWTAITLFLLMTTLFLWEERKREWIPPLWISIAATSAITVIMKMIISRPRPFETLTLPLIQGAHYTFAAWNTAFPSLHTAAVFSLVPILDKEFPKIKWFWIALAVLISLSRVYIGVHYLSDVIAGAFIGVLVSNIIIKLEKKYKLFKK